MLFIKQKLTIFFLMIAPLIFAQKNGNTIQVKIDKLESKLEHVSEKEKAEYLLKLCELYWQLNPEKSIRYGKQAIEMYEKIDTEKVPDALIDTSIAFFYSNQKDSTIYYINRILHNYTSSLSDHHYGVCHNLLCVVYRYKGEYENALENGEKALKYFYQAGDTLRAAGTIGNMSMIYENIGNYKKSLEYSLQSLMISERKKDSTGIAFTEANISTLYANMKDYEYAKKYLNRATKIFHALNRPYELANLYNNYGTLYIDTKKYDSAYYMLKSALKIYRQIHSKDGEGTVWHNIGLVNNFQRKYTSAIRNLEKAANIFREVNRIEDLTDVYADLGDVYTRINQPEKAELYLKKAEAHAREIHHNRYKIKISRLLYQLYEKTGNYPSAYRYHLQFTQLKDSTENAEVKKQIAGLELQYQNVKKQKEIEHLQSQKKIQEIKNRNLLLISTGLIGFILLGGFFIFQQRKKEMTINRLNREKSLLKEKQLTLDLEHSRKRLAAQILNIIHRNSLLKNYLQILDDIDSSDDIASKRQINLLKKDMKKTLKAKKDWDNFEEYFIKSDPDFIEKLKTENPKLTNLEIRLASLIRIGMTNKEISNVLNVNIQSIKNSLYRMKKKLDLDADISLREFLSSL